MKKSAEILGLSIISIWEGKELGTAKDIVIDAAKGEVAAIVVEDGKWYLGAKILPFTAIQGIGEYALTIESGTAVVPLSSLEEITALLETDVRVKGTKVLTKGGKMQGQVTEINIDEQSGKISGCEIKLVNGDIGNIPAEQVITFGKDVLVIQGDSDVAVSPAQNITPQETAAPRLQAQIAVPQQQPAVPAQAAVVKPEIKPSPPAPAPATTTATGTGTETNANAAPAVDNPTQVKEDLSKKFDEKHRKFVLGKKSTRRIETDNGELIVDQGGDITDEVIQKAKDTGKFVELTMSIAP